MRLRNGEPWYGRYDRNRISVEIWKRIKYRRNSNLYSDSLPERLRASRKEGGQTCYWTWLSHDVISFEELSSFPSLQWTVERAMTGRSETWTGHPMDQNPVPFIYDWGSPRLMETFILDWDKTRALHIPNVHEMTQPITKEWRKSWKAWSSGVRVVKTRSRISPWFSFSPLRINFSDKWIS